ncbi:MAG: metallophosphoesterase [Chloroherpetonaceae bacterium]|nr:metallophosphoesterase [Chloroherpetonaceae bacterium]MCS7211178.1 metallophosphoesterase [Chloroherpetonaceae bacterium]MDW8020323.1 metallophosphoesterase [Chloroherpetonaceae bacterium]
MKIAHISDLHLDSDTNPDCLSEIDSLIKKIFDSGFDHLVMTGDIVDVVNFQDLWHLREILEKNGVLSWEHVTIIPGNHDIFGKYEMNGIIGLRDTALRALESTGIRYHQKLHEFCEIFRETITDKPDESLSFPFVKIFQNRPHGVALVAFNSVLEWSLKINPSGSRGYIHAEERCAIEQAEVRAALKDKFTIALFHHAYKIYEPQNAADKAFIWSMELIEREAFLKTLKNIGVRLALHGHYHKAEEYRIDGIHFINSGSVRRSGSKFNAITIYDDGSYENRFIRL